TPIPLTATAGVGMLVTSLLTYVPLIHTHTHTHTRHTHTHTHTQHTTHTHTSHTHTHTHAHRHTCRAVSGVSMGGDTGHLWNSQADKHGHQISRNSLRQCSIHTHTHSHTHTHTQCYNKHIIQMTKK